MESQRYIPQSGQIHRRIALALQAVIAIGLASEMYEGQWLNVAAVFGILLLTLLPHFLARWLEVFIPPEIELLAIAFIFAAIFLGETRDFYGRFWWWDIALHATSGGLLGIFGFLLVYLLNANPRIKLDMRPGFLAFFAFCFSVSVGVMWEIFEFAMDQLLSTNMQKSMQGDAWGLSDTMSDLIVDALGALAIALMGYYYMSRGLESIIERWILKFIAANPRLFARKRTSTQRGADGDTEHGTDRTSTRS